MVSTSAFTTSIWRGVLHCTWNRAGLATMPAVHRARETAKSLIPRLLAASGQCVVFNAILGNSLVRGRLYRPLAGGETCPFGNEQTPEALIRHTIAESDAWHCLIKLIETGLRIRPAEKKARKLVGVESDVFSGPVEAKVRELRRLPDIFQTEQPDLPATPTVWRREVDSNPVSGFWACVQESPVSGRFPKQVPTRMGLLARRHQSPHQSQGTGAPVIRQADHRVLNQRSLSA
jgi:hypothetical protein